MKLSAFAPAKVNLFLHVGGAGEDGYHPICSLMTFADVGDTVAVQRAETPEFEVTGPFASGLEGDNLVVRAAQALRQGTRGPTPPLRLILDKRLPVAAGLGGGSSDAGATLRLLSEALELSVPDGTLEAIAASLGADGAACLRAETVIAQGRGERLSPAPAMPVLDAVLVNPGVASSTPAVYRAFDDMGASGGAERPWLPDAFESAEDVAAFLSVCRNDLQAPAISLQPAIGEVLETLADEPETLLARMSGSGSTCFALCAGDIEAEGLAERLQAMRRNWWVCRCRLGALY
ncbi:MAG TPA: 4-(cytidine 5'-diphospho)-2-C-methyl-D-erythritol kinase [Caulobacteraceae bacterium]|nr:4-(cytidine 5'-diphospho)-2-C-methyl-D-erythritol kinase [Caulobacteraceae bacterium]